MLNVSNTVLEMALAHLLIKGLPQEAQNIFTWKFTVECEEIREKDIEAKAINDFLKNISSCLLLKNHLASLIIPSRCFE